MIIYAIYRAEVCMWMCMLLWPCMYIKCAARLIAKIAWLRRMYGVWTAAAVLSRDIGWTGDWVSLHAHTLYRVQV